MNIHHETSRSNGIELLPLLHESSQPPRTTHPGTHVPARGPWSTALAFSLLMLALCGVLYPAIATWIGATAFPFQAGGSVLYVSGHAVGSALVAQPFAARGYFQPRPSTSGFDPMAMSGSNLAPSNPELRRQIQTRLATIARREGVSASRIPGDLVYASGSSIDPDISPAAARLQVPRVARARHLAEEDVLRLVAAHTHQPVFGILGQSRVNVLELNLALDVLSNR